MITRLTTSEIWERLNQGLRRFIRRGVSDEHAADDLLQETFIRIHRNLGTLEEDDRLAAWVYRIARNVIHDHHRKRSPAEVGIPDEVPADGDEERRAGCLPGGWVMGMVDRLPEPYREAVRLREADGLSFDELAGRLGISVSGAKSRVQRGRAMLKEAMEECCRFEFDRRGNLWDCEPNAGPRSCPDCDP